MELVWLSCVQPTIRDRERKTMANNATATRTLLTLALAGVLLAALAVSSPASPAEAIDPTLDAALIAIARATAQEQDRRNSVAATSAALSAQATSVAVEAARQAGYARATTQAQEMNDAATRRASDAAATQQARDVSATAMQQSRNANGTATASAVMATRQSSEATVTANVMNANATATVSSMQVQATAESIASQQQASTRNGIMLTAAICVCLFVVVFVGWRLIEYLRQSQKTMAAVATANVSKKPIVIVESNDSEQRQRVYPETIVVNDPQALEKWAAILEMNK